MRRFLSVCLSLSTIIHISENIIARSTTSTTLRMSVMSENVFFAVTGRAHCRRQVAFFYIFTVHKGLAQFVYMIYNQVVCGQQF